jgi:hypothetical protein
VAFARSAPLGFRIEPVGGDTAFCLFVH